MRLTAGGLLNGYILEGGLNLYLEVYGGNLRRREPPPAAFGDDPPAFAFRTALGDRYPFSRPDIRTVPERSYVKKVKIETAASFEGGGCE